LSKVNRLDRVNILLVEQAQQTKTILLLKLVSFPWLDSIELSLPIHLRALLARQQLIIYLLLKVVMLQIASWRGSILDASFGPMVISSSRLCYDSGIALLSLWLRSLLSFFVGVIFRLLKSLDRFKVKILIFEWQVHLLKFISLGFDLDLKRHQSVVEQPIL
jgi:hypothetical protein